MQIIPFPFEKRMLLYVQNNVETTGRTAEVAGFS